jgi:hypothetical protein
MSDNNEEYPETGTGGGGTTLVTDPGTENAVAHDESTTPQVGIASEATIAILRSTKYRPHRFFNILVTLRILRFCFVQQFVYFSKDGYRQNKHII